MFSSWLRIAAMNRGVNSGACRVKSLVGIPNRWPVRVISPMPARVGQMDLDLDAAPLLASRDRAPQAAARLRLPQHDPRRLGLFDGNAPRLMENDQFERRHRQRDGGGELADPRSVRPLGHVAGYFRALALSPLRPERPPDEQARLDHFVPALAVQTRDRQHRADLGERDLEPAIRRLGRIDLDGDRPGRSDGRITRRLLPRRDELRQSCRCEPRAESPERGY